MAVSLPPLVLRNGTRIEGVLETALEFVKQDGSYRSYDLAPVEQDDVLTEADIRVANAMIARMSPQVIAGIAARAPVINSALGQIPTSASLAAADDAIPWQALEELMRAIDGIPEVKLARQTKVLHKKRPALIPILDSVLETYLRRVDGLRRTGDPARDAVELIRSYKCELDATLPTLRSLQQELRRRGINLTECRLLAVTRPERATLVDCRLIYLRMADAFVQAGASDAFNAYRFPSKLPEFLAMGRPVVLPDCNIGLELTDGRNALLLREGTALEIAAKVERLLGGQELARRLGEGAREFAVRQLSPSQSAATLSEFLARVVSESRDAPSALSLQAGDQGAAGQRTPLAPRNA